VKITETPGLTTTGNQVSVNDALRLLAETSSSGADAPAPSPQQRQDPESRLTSRSQNRGIRSEVLWWGAATGTLLLGFSGIRYLQVASCTLLAVTLALDVRRRKQPRGIIDQALGIPETGSSVRRMITRTVSWGRHLDSENRQNSPSRKP
jgi:hypothetical protein